MKNPQFRFEGPMNVIEPITDQFPGTTTDYYAVQHWADVSDSKENWGVTFSPRHSPMVQFSENWPDYVSQAHHLVTSTDFEHDFLSDPSQLTKDHIYSYIANNNFETNFAISQPGQALVCYSLTSHSGDWKTGSAKDFGRGYCTPVSFAVLKGVQAGNLPTSQSFCSVDKANVIITTIKKAEGNNGIIVRLLETEGTETKVKVKLPFLKFNKAVETNLVEEDIGDIACEGDSFSINIPAWSCATVRLKS